MKFISKFNFTLRMGASTLTLLAAVFLAAAYNTRFWHSFAGATGAAGSAQLALLAGSFLIVALLFNAGLTLASFRPVLKPVLVLFFVVSAAISYFTNAYGTAIDRSMVQNMIETDPREVFELLSWQLLLTVALLGVLPSLLLARIEVVFSPGARGLLRRAGAGALSLALALAMLVIFFKSLAPTLREHRELRYLLAPTNYIQAVHAYSKHRHAQSVVVAPLGEDAFKGRRRSSNHHRSVTLIVVGETARAANFSLNGYTRQTNPELARQAGLLNFTDVQSCGTATAVSVPCVFSVLGRDAYSDDKARSQQGLLDVLSHAGFEVLWRDNNSGCKGVCDRVAFEDLSRPQKGNRWCVEDECYDERLLDRLPQIIHDARDDLVVVLHQKGSHGPAYFKRYPAQYKRFGPVCETNDLEHCSRESIVAAYDNSILYTDHFLNSAVELLKASVRTDGVNAAMLYFSDHGESLGEHNLYLHGAPYIVSPREQRAVPFMLWLSDGFRARFQIDQTCLAARTGQSFSHDNVFHSVLGMLGVNTAVYNPRLDIVAPCIYDA